MSIVGSDLPYISTEEFSLRRSFLSKILHNKHPCFCVRIPCLNFSRTMHENWNFSQEESLLLCTSSGQQLWQRNSSVTAVFFIRTRWPHRSGCACKFPWIPYSRTKLQNTNTRNPEEWMDSFLARVPRSFCRRTSLPWQSRSRVADTSCTASPLRWNWYHKSSPRPPTSCTLRCHCRKIFHVSTWKRLKRKLDI